MFNQDVSQLPNSLTHLIFGDDLNQNVSHLPNSLTHLTFSYNFNQDVSQLPKCLIYLTFDKYGLIFEQSLNPYLYYLTSFEIDNNHKHKDIMKDRCKINQHNIAISEDKLIDLLLKKMNIL